MRDELSHALLGSCIQHRQEKTTEYIFGILRSRWKSNRNILSQKLRKLEDEGALEVRGGGKFRHSRVRITDWRQAAVSRLILSWSYDFNMPISSYQTSRHIKGSENRLKVLRALYNRPCTPKELYEKTGSRSMVHWEHLRELVEQGLVELPEIRQQKGNSYSFIGTAEDYFISHLHPIMQKAVLFRHSLSQGISREDFMRGNRSGTSYSKLQDMLKKGILSLYKDKLKLAEKYHDRPYDLIADMIDAGGNRLNNALRDMAKLYAEGFFDDRTSFRATELIEAGAKSRYISVFLRREEENNLLRRVVNSNDRVGWMYSLSRAGHALVENVIMLSEEIMSQDMEIDPAESGIPHILLHTNISKSVLPQENYIKLSPESFGILMVAFKERDWDIALVQDLAQDRIEINGYIMPSMLELKDVALRGLNELKSLGLVDKNDNLTRHAESLKRYFVI